MSNTLFSIQQKPSGWIEGSMNKPIENKPEEKCLTTNKENNQRASREEERK